MRISTKKGDCGETGLFNGKRVKKFSPIICALGELDELNSFLGFAKAGIKDVYLFDLLSKTQKCICKMMAVMGNGMMPVKCSVRESDESSVEMGMNICEKDIQYLEKNIGKMERASGEIDKFSIPGESEISARLHLARSVCRRAERAMVKAMATKKTPFLIYLNRLSDLLFLTARFFE